LLVVHRKWQAERQSDAIDPQRKSPGVPHNITNVSEKPARVLMTVSPPGHEHYFEELAKLAAQGSPDPKALAELRNRYDTDQLSTLTAGP
jgi:hypothetical protein